MQTLEQEIEREMREIKLWIKVLAGVITGVVFFSLVVLLVVCCRRRRRQLVPKTGSPQFMESVTRARSQTLHAGLARLHRSYKPGGSRRVGFLFHHLDRSNQHLRGHRHQITQQQQQGAADPFDWNHHPGLVNDAVENGWSRFTFTARSSVFGSSRSMPLWGLCAVCDGGVHRDAVETNWEVPLGSSEFMQTVRLNPEAKSSLQRDDYPVCSVRMCLPLPGPSLGASSFPQEAYFEITILYLKGSPPQQQKQWSSRTGKRSKAGGAGREGDRKKLIEGTAFDARSDSSVHELSIDSPIDMSSPLQGPKAPMEEEEDGGSGHFMVSLGLTVGGGSLPGRTFPGSYPGSIGFNSDGSVYLDGMQLVPESEKARCAEANMVIGCGFEPNKKKVFFTADGQLMHAIHCNSDAYKAPLYPVIAASTDVMVLVNLGQSRFRYAPANAFRTPNPCFLRSVSVDSSAIAAAAIGYDDSRELFSMDRINSEWLDTGKRGHSSSKQSSDPGAGVDFDVESELFEISLHN